MINGRACVGVILGALTAVVCAAASPAFAEPTTPPSPPPKTTEAPPPSPPATTGPSADADNHSANVYGEQSKDTSGSQAGTPPPGQDGPSNPSQAGGPRAPKVKNAPKDVKVQISSEPCSDRGDTRCSQGRAACDTSAGGGGYAPPTITWIKVGDGPWIYHGLSCGPPTEINLPGGGGSVQVQAPPVPTFAQIQTAFRELPFSKPTVTVQPKGMRTLKNFQTYYAATWPNDTGLQPGETSTKIKLLSWTVEFKVAARDYRYDYGDGTTSAWTTSPGGTHPDGDITHTYSQTGDMDVKVDARLTGQYRVNGGDWQDIATTADLQDEPIDTLEVVGTRTRLTH